jgi:hypothetical protein
MRDGSPRAVSLLLRDTIPQSDPRAATIFVDEDDTSALKRLLNLPSVFCG